MKPSNPGTHPRAFFDWLRAHALTFACAESCTGGLLAQQMTALPGVSAVFWGGVVVYSNAAKHQLLGVPQALLENHGAVSGPVALALVQGLARLSQAALAVSVTGVAGPLGGTAAKPVGTVWFGLAAQTATGPRQVALEYRFAGSRAAIQRQAARKARQLAVQWWNCDPDLDRPADLPDNRGKHLLSGLFFQSTVRSDIPLNIYRDNHP